MRETEDRRPETELAKPVVYIAGKVTGLEYVDAKHQFDTRAAELRAMGYIVVNPMDIVPKDTDWQQAMKICILALVTSDYIDLLPNWKDSQGAMLERRLAWKLGIKLFKKENNATRV